MFAALKGLRVQLLLWAVIPLTLIVVGISGLSIISHRHAMRTLVAERNSQMAAVSAQFLDERLFLHIRLLETVALQLDERAPGLHEFDGGLFLANAAGDLSPISTTSLSAKRAQAIAASLESGRAHNVTPPFVDPETGQPTLIFTVPYKDGGQILGLASAEHLQLAALMRSIGMGRRGSVRLVDANGLVVYQADGQRSGEDLSGQTAVEQVRRGNRGTAFQQQPGGEETVLGFAPLLSTGWGLIIEEPWADQVAPTMKVSEMTPIVVAVTASAALLVLFFGMRYIIQPLRALEQEAQRVANGDLEAIREPVGGIDEITSLQGALNQMTTQIRAYQTTLRDYLTALTRAEEEERRRVARDLHDDTVQTLIALIHRLDRCEQMADGSEQLTCRLEETRDLAGQALDGLRSVIYNLRPLYLEDLGLIPAMEALVRETERKTGAPSIRLLVTEPAARMSSETELTIFRILQEALANVARHAAASEAEVTLEFGQPGVTLTVHDNGLGFDAPRSPEGLARKGHFGLIGMRERALRMGGQFSVRSSIGDGTTLVLVLPRDEALPDSSSTAAP